MAAGTLASYGLGTESSGAVQLLGDVPAGLTGRQVLIVDDIVDTGRSIAYAVAELHRCGIGELWTCVLLDKPQRRQIEIAIDFVVLKRPAGRPPQEVRRYFASFSYEAQSWKKPRRVVAKVEWHAAELYPRVGFIVTNLARPGERVVGFYNQRGTAEQWIKEGKGAIKWTRLSCRTFAANAVRLQLHALAYNLGNFMRTLAMPKAAQPWSLTSLREKLIKIGAKVVSHGRYVTFQMAEVAVSRQMFQEILTLIARLRTLPAPA